MSEGGLLELEKVFRVPQKPVCTKALDHQILPEMNSRSSIELAGDGNSALRIGKRSGVMEPRDNGNSISGRVKFLRICENRFRCTFIHAKFDSILHLFEHCQV